MGSLLVIPGRAKGANPESRNKFERSPWLWIPGSPLRGAPE
jgi:hypothetical protein